MARVSKDTLEKLNAFIDSLPPEAKSKCALCNETLTHIVKQAEAQTGAGTATVTRALSDEINRGAAEGDRVSDRALSERVRRMDDGIKNTNRVNNQTLGDGSHCPNCEKSDDCEYSDPPRKPEKRAADGAETQGESKPDFEVAMKYAKMAVADLRQISNRHHDWEEALDYVDKWTIKARRDLS